ncbi:MAG: methylamine dehydrogenase heavy chain [Pseudohongiellaceae bacterium]|jgi:methylamine dehydrogenase heavy chain
MFKSLVCGVVAAMSATIVNAQKWDTTIGYESLKMQEKNPHWFSVRGSEIAYLIDGDTGKVGGTITLSSFSPAIRPHMDRGLIYAYASYYTRNVYGDRTDLVIAYDAETTLPITEIEIPTKAAGIGHSGFIGLIKDRFIGVWNVTPGISVSIVDTETNEFLHEISTPACAGIYPVESGFLTICADGRVQLIEMDDAGAETGRFRSEVFFNVLEDPVYDYAVASDDGWVMVSMDGMVFEATVEGEDVLISEPWSINPPDLDLADRNGMVVAPDDDWRIGGQQPFAYSPDTGILSTVMHKGGGQETFEDSGTEIWSFNVVSKRRGYRFAVDEGESISSVQFTQDDDPLMMVAVSGNIQIRTPKTGALVRVVEQIRGSLIQNLFFD